jgi:hypothetical protein
MELEYACSHAAPGGDDDGGRNNNAIHLFRVSGMKLIVVVAAASAAAVSLACVFGSFFSHALYFLLASFRQSWSLGMPGQQQTATMATPQVSHPFG